MHFSSMPGILLESAILQHARNAVVQQWDGVFWDRGGIKNMSTNGPIREPRQYGKSLLVIRQERLDKNITRHI